MRLQRLHIGPSIVCLLAALVASSAAAADADAPLLRSGSLEIAFDPEMLSSLPVDASALRQGLCSGLPPVDGARPITPQGECELAVRSPPRLGLFAEIDPTRSPLRAAVHPTDLPSWEASTEVETPCGLWTVSMALDPDAEQPVSELALEPSEGGSSQGVFAGVVRLAVLFHFDNPEKGLSLDVPATVPLDLAGHWATFQGNDPGLGASRGSTSNLVLFAGILDGVLESFDGLGTWGIRRCPVIPVPPISIVRH